MKVSAGVIVIACITFIGSTLLFLMVLGMGALIFLPMPVPNDMPNQAQFPMEFFKVIFIFAALMYIAPAVWGFLSGVGLLKAKNWARISTIVFSILLICHSLFSLLMTGVVMTSAFAALPSADKLDSHVPLVVGIVLAVFWLSQTALGVWWLVYLTRPNVKAQFVKPQMPLQGLYGVQTYPGMLPQQQGYQPVAYQPQVAATSSRRPVSIIIIACWILLGCASIPMNVFMRAPAFLMTKVFTGWPAALYYVAVAGVLLYVGIGLLKLQEAARITAMAWIVFSFVNGAVFFLAPGREARMATLLAASMKMFPWMNSEMFPFKLDLAPFMYFGMIFGMALMAVPLYFLITRRKAFQTAA